jgi:hypothetical protein
MTDNQVHVNFTVTTATGSIKVMHLFEGASKDETGKQLHRLYWQIRDALRLEDAGL